MDKNQLEQEVVEQQHEALQNVIEGESLSLRDRALLMSGEYAPRVAGIDDKPALVLTLGAAGMTASEIRYRYNALNVIKKRQAKDQNG